VKRRRLLITGALALAVAALLAYGGTSLLRVWQMKREVQMLERDLQVRRAETDCLTQTVDRLREDPGQIEKIAREELGLVKKGETVLKFPSTRPQEKTC